MNKLLTVSLPTGQFNAWMKRHDLSLSAAAQALHLVSLAFLSRFFN
jgi:hypothetical protein